VRSGLSLCPIKTFQNRGVFSISSRRGDYIVAKAKKWRIEPALFQCPVCKKKFFSYLVRAWCPVCTKENEESVEEEDKGEIVTPE